MGFPAYMGNLEAFWFQEAIRSLPVDVAELIFSDRRAFELFHQAYFGFRDDIARDEMPFYQEQFKDYMRNTYGIDWDQLPFPWAEYRRLYRKGGMRANNPRMS